MLVGGGGAPGPQPNKNVEIYNPPYLYDAAGQRALQARLTSAPANIDIGETFFADFTDAADISRVTMVKSGSVTHSWNMEQRFVELTFARSGSRLRIQAPTRAAEAPPGFWLLFALNENGVPSHAQHSEDQRRFDLESRNHADAREPGQPVDDCRRCGRAAARGFRSERR